MTTDADRVRFAVRFANEKNVMTLSGAALSRCREELAAFLGMTRTGAAAPGGFGVQVVNVRPPYPWDYPKGQLVELQEDVRRFLENEVLGDVEHPFLKNAVLKDVRHPTTISDDSDDQPLVADVVTVGGKRRGRIGGSVRAAFLLTLWFLRVAGTGVPAVLKCPECGRLFVRVRRQKYCRDACTDKATWRNYPQKKKLAARKKYYESQGWILGTRSERKHR